jgi:pilus assembly protein TadC
LNDIFLNRYDGLSRPLVGKFEGKFIFDMSKSGFSKEAYFYHSPIIFLGIFYLILLIWTGICLLLMGSIELSFGEFSFGWPLARMIMIAFVMVYTWYFSLAISYKIGITEHGDIELTSFRRVVRVNAEVIGMVEGPKWAMMPYGFVRFRLEREKAYIFCCINDTEFEQYMKILKDVNPEMVLKGI